jgi:multidrug efflux pump subunit AcrA (membrane-fusion protein)
MPPATDAAPAPTDAPPAEPSVALVEQSAGPAGEPLPKWAVPATGGALALALVLMVPLPRSVPASVVLEAPNAVVVKAPRDLVVKEPAVKNGTAIESGAVLLTLDGSDELGRMKPFDAKVNALQSELEHTQRTVSKKQIASWQKTVRKIEGEIEKAKGALAKASSEKARTAAQKKVADKERELLEANAELQDATKVDAMAKLKQQLEQATAARDQAAGQQAVLPSPAAGVVTELAATPGQRITSGAPIARIADPHELVVACSVDASEALSLAPGQKIDATLKGQNVELLAESVAGPKVFAKIVQADKPAFIPGDTGDAKISVASKSLLGRLFR